MYTGYYEWPMGRLKICADMAGIRRIEFCTGEVNENDDQTMPTDERGMELFKEACRQLDLYFQGRQKKFDLPLKPEGTDFQKSVWKALLTIPYGETRSYKEIAEAVGNEKACRAVGMANHKNPIVIVIPCHRVVGSSGSMTGYGGGIPAKKWLLALEKQHA